MTDREMGIEEARKSLGDLVLDAQRDGTATRITRKGKPAAVIVSADWYEQAQITIIDAARGV